MPWSKITHLFRSFNHFCHHYSNQYLKRTPPGIVHDWSLKSPQDLFSQAEDLINNVKKLYDKVASVPDSDVSFESVLKVLNEAECWITTNIFFLDFPQYVALDKGVRNASEEASHKVNEFIFEIRMRKDVFEKLLVLQKKGEAMKPEAQRYLEKLILAGKRNGLHLEENTQKRVKEISTKINNLANDFIDNLNDVATTLEFSEEELAGVTPDFLEGLMKNPDNGKYEVAMRDSHYLPIMEKCKVPETRKCLEFAFNTKCIEENGLILTELRKYWHEMAVLLGYPCHAAYKTEKLMSKNIEAVNKFLTELAERMTPFWQEEKQYLLELKEKECAELGVPFDGKLNIYDTTYYCTKAKETKYGVDKTKLREYFPFPVVKEGLLNIYQDLLGLKFEQVKGKVWHDDVELYSVTDSSSGTLLGYFFLDMFFRPTKYGRAAFFELQHGFNLPDGKRQVAVCAMVADFRKRAKDVPALLDHDEVTKLFHQFGHAMHYLCVENEFAHLNIASVECDFIDAPSQMFENWCWKLESLKRMSSHYLDKSEIPADMLNALIKSRTANTGFSTLCEIVLALYDQTINESPEGDTRDLFYDLVRKYLGTEPQPGTHFACHFSHLIRISPYYGSLGSAVYAMDMFETRFGGNIFNPEVGKDFRDKILRPAGTKDAIDLVISFLGRKPTQDAFLRSKGLKV